MCLKPKKLLGFKIIYKYFKTVDGVFYMICKFYNRTWIKISFNTFPINKIAGIRNGSLSNRLIGSVSYTTKYVILSGKDEVPN